MNLWTSFIVMERLNMNYIRVGNSGLKITEITFGAALTIGTESSDPNYAYELIDKAWDVGIRSFDVSNNYGMGEAERLVGKALSKYNREEYVLATKGSWAIGETPYHKGLSRKHILWAFEESRNRLNSDYVDIYYAHRYDPETSMEEIVRTYNYLIQSGKVRYWATSEWTVEALTECHCVCNRLGLEKPILEQSFCSFVVQKVKSNGVKEFCDKNGVGMLGFGSLAQGLLTGKYQNGIPKGSRIDKSILLNYSTTAKIYEQNKERIEQFVQLCNEYNVKGSHLAIRWCIKEKIYPVIGASRPEQLVENVAALSAEIPEELWDRLDDIK